MRQMDTENILYFLNYVFNYSLDRQERQNNFLLTPPAPAAVSER